MENGGALVVGITFGELNKETVFVRNKRWYKKTSDKESGKTTQHDGWGTAIGKQLGRINFFGNNQEVELYEFRQICKW